MKKRDKRKRMRKRLERLSQPSGDSVICAPGDTREGDGLTRELGTAPEGDPPTQQGGCEGA